MNNRELPDGYLSCNRNEEKQHSFPTMMGGSSLLVIFAVLCLTVFALLGLSTVLADKRLADASAKAVAAYYEADCRAEEIFAQLRSSVGSSSATEDMDMVLRELGVCRSSSGDTREESYTYTCPISDTQTLWVEVKRESDCWKVLRWQAVAKAQLQELQLELWDGETTS